MSSWLTNSATSSITSSTTSGGASGAAALYYTSSSTNTGTTTFNIAVSGLDLVQLGPFRPQEWKIPDGHAVKITLPDGTLLDVKADGSYTIEDKDAKVVYRAARIRDFNRFVNASDQLEAFIRWCGQQGVKRDEMLQLPIELFIGWLIVEAAKADKEPVVPALPDLRPKQGRCTSCGRFLSRKKTAAKIAFCDGACLDRRLACI